MKKLYGQLNLLCCFLNPHVLWIQHFQWQIFLVIRQYLYLGILRSYSYSVDSMMTGNIYISPAVFKLLWWMKNNIRDILKPEKHDCHNMQYIAMHTNICMFFLFCFIAVIGYFYHKKVKQWVKKSEGVIRDACNDYNHLYLKANSNQYNIGFSLIVTWILASHYIGLDCQGELYSSR